MCWEGRDTRFVFVELFNQSTETIKVTRVLRESCLFVAVVVILSLFFCSIIFFGLVVSFVSYSIQKFPMTAFLPLGLSSSAPASSCNNLVAMHCFHSRCTDCRMFLGNCLIFMAKASDLLSACSMRVHAPEI